MSAVVFIELILSAAEAVIIDEITKIFSRKPKAKDPVEEIKPYLTAILQDMEVIQKQNTAIYEKVNKLPLVVAAMVTKIFEEKNLQERYDTLSALRTRFEAMGSAAQLDVVTSSGYNDLTQSLDYIFRNERKIGSLSEMLAYMDFADLATKQQSEIRKGLSAIVQLREQKINSLLTVFTEQFISPFNEIELLLDSQYFTENNMSTIQSFHEITYKPSADRYMTETYTTYTKRPVESGRTCCRTNWEIITETHQREVIDSVFSIARNAAVAELPILINKAIELEETIRAIRSDQATLSWYREAMLSQNSFSNVVSFLVEPASNDLEENYFGQGKLVPPFLPMSPKCYGE